jgi:hypothetical protein
MSGRNSSWDGLAVVAVAVMGVAAAIGEMDSKSRPPAAKAPAPRPERTVIVQHTVTHYVTRIKSGSPLAGWEITLMVIVAIGAAVAVALSARRGQQ